jgi:hypothetical protein
MRDEAADVGVESGPLAEVGVPKQRQDLRKRLKDYALRNSEAV